MSFGKMNKYNYFLLLIAVPFWYKISSHKINFFSYIFKNYETSKTSKMYLRIIVFVKITESLDFIRYIAPCLCKISAHKISKTSLNCIFHLNTYTKEKYQCEKKLQIDLAQYIHTQTRKIHLKKYESLQLFY